MKRRFIFSISTGSAALALAAMGCQTGPVTSSSSNWVICEAPVDCAGVPGAVDCLEGYCVDEAGERVERFGGGAGSDGVASGGADASGGSGGSGSSAGGGGGPMNSGGASASGGAGSGGAAFDLACTDFQMLAGCTLDEDCTTGTRTTDCCGTMAVTGVAVGQEDEFTTLANECALQYPACACPTPAFPMADDGRWLTSGQASVSCVEGLCKSNVGERPCGDTLTCAEGELCLRSTTVLGPTETEEYSCAENPCAGQELDCACADSACALDDGRSRICSVSLSATEDLYCQDQAQ